MPHPTRQVEPCANCKHAMLHGSDPGRLRCNHPESPVDVVSGVPELCKFGRGPDRYGGWCGVEGRLFTPANGNSSSVQGVGDCLGGGSHGAGLHVGSQ